MGIFDKFFTVTPTTQKPVTEDKKVSKVSAGGGVAPAVKTTSFGNGELPPTTTDAATYTGTATQQAMDYFANLIKEKNLPGNDYVEFIDATLDEGFKAFPTEQNRYIAAFVGLKRAGMSKAILVDTATKYQSLIDEDLNNMEQAFTDAYNQQVEGKRKAIEEKNARMQQLSQEIEQLNAEAQQLQQEAMENENTLNSNKNSFAQAAKATKDKINVEIDKINRWLAD
jgi:vacuolar-type H+-ATPase subunit I/STV1